MRAPADPLTVTHDHRGDTVIVHVMGEVDLFTAPILECALSAGCAKLPDTSGKLVIDLGRAQFIGAVALTLLVSTSERCDRRGASLWVVANSPAILVPLAADDLRHRFTVVENLDDAIRPPRPRPPSTNRAELEVVPSP